jgi:hypothetical protein
MSLYRNAFLSINLLAITMSSALAAGPVPGSDVNLETTVNFAESTVFTASLTPVSRLTAGYYPTTRVIAYLEMQPPADTPSYVAWKYTNGTADPTDNCQMRVISGTTNPANQITVITVPKLATNPTACSTDGWQVSNTAGTTNDGISLVAGQTVVSDGYKIQATAVQYTN